MIRTAAERATTVSQSPPSTPRLVLRPVSGPGGAVRTVLDGGWWPRTGDPVAELPGLILALDRDDPGHGPGARAPKGGPGPVTHVMLRVADWDSRPRRLRIDPPDRSADGTGRDRVVRLGWFDTMPAGLLTALCAGGRRIDLFTVPPSTGQAAAQAAMRQAADPRNRQHATDLLSALATPAPRPAPPTGRAETESAATAATAGWETEGGRLREDAGRPPG